MQIKEFTEEEIQHIYMDAVRAELRRAAVARVAEFSRREAENAVRAISELVIKDLTPYIKERAEAWVRDNLDALIEKKAGELVSAAIGGIKRRLEGR